MGWTKRWRKRLRALLRKEAVERELDEELALHLELETQKNLRAGMSPAEARRRAVLAFGGVERHKEEVREARTLGWVPGMSLDFRLGFRMLAKYPGLTLIGGLAMAFAIWVGASTFEFLSQVVSPSLPLEDGDRIVALRNRDVEASRIRREVLHDFVTWREELETVEDLGAFRTIERNLLAPGVAAGPVEVAEMSASGFRVARVPPLLGRTLVEEDERPGAPAVLVLGHEAWTMRFGADPAVVGRTVRLGDEEVTVVGVMPEGFAFPVAHGMWVPLRLSPLDFERGQGPSLDVFGRLVPGVSLREAQAELAALGRSAAADFPQTHEHLRPEVVPYAKSFLDLSGAVSVLVMSANLFLVLLLVLVCGNVALLMFARAATREGEIVVRNALGASRRRIVAQLFAEALVLAGLSALVGLAAARYGLRVLFSLVEHEVLEGERLPFWFDAGLSPAAVLYTVALTLLGAAIAGVVPALKVTRGLGARLRQAGAGGGGFRFGGVWTAVIVTQVAVTVFFPVMAYFTQRDMARLRAAEVGFAEEEYLAVRLEADRADPRATLADTSRAALLARFGATYRELERRLEADPAVTGVTFGDRLPRMYHPHRLIEMDEGGEAVPDPRWPGHRVSSASVGTDFFEVLGAPILAGRGFHSGDLAPDARVVVVNESFVRRVLDGRNPIGRRVRHLHFEEREGHIEEWDGTVPAEEPWYEIVGVVPDLGMSFGEGDPKIAGFYHPVAPGTASAVHLAVHVRGEPEAFTPRLRALAAAVDPTLRLHDPLPMDALDEAELRFLGSWLWIIAGVSGVTLLLSLAGIYAVMAFTVAQRTREIGIRVALGADARRLVVEIFRRPLTQVVLGIFLGGCLTAALPAFVGGELSAQVAGVVLAVMGLTLAVCLLACIVPTRRALGVEPTEALRAEG